MKLFEIIKKGAELFRDSGTENAGRRAFFKQLAVGVTSAAAAPGLEQLSPPQAPEKFIELTPKPLDVKAAADCIFSLFTDPVLAKQIVYAARAANAAQSLQFNLMRHKRLENNHASRFAPQFEQALLPDSLQLAVNLASSGSPTLSPCTGVTALESNPLIVHTARIVGLGILIPHGLYLPLLAPRVDDPHAVECSPAIRFSCHIKHHDGSPSSITESCKKALQLGMNPEMVPAFAEVLQERTELLRELEARGWPPNVHPEMQSNAMLINGYRLHGIFKCEEKPDWGAFLLQVGSLFGLAVNLPLNLKSLKILEGAAPKKKRPDFVNVLQAILNPSEESAAWLSRYPAYNALTRLQPILEQIANPVYPPASVLLRHGGTMQDARAVLTKAGIPEKKMVSQLCSIGDREYLAEVLAKRNSLFQILDRPAESEASNAPRTFRADLEPKIRELSSTFFKYPVPMLTSASSVEPWSAQHIIRAKSIRQIAVREADGSETFWKQVKTPSGKQYLEELLGSNLRTER